MIMKKKVLEHIYEKVKSGISVNESQRFNFLSNQLNSLLEIENIHSSLELRLGLMLLVAQYDVGKIEEILNDMNDLTREDVDLVKQLHFSILKEKGFYSEKEHELLSDVLIFENIGIVRLARFFESSADFDSNNVLDSVRIICEQAEEAYAKIRTLSVQKIAFTRIENMRRYFTSLKDEIEFLDKIKIPK